MNEDTARRGWRRWGGVAAIAAVGLLAGAVIAGTVTATADPTTTPSAPDSAAADAQDPRAPGGGRPGGGRPGGEAGGEPGGEAGGEAGGEPRDESRSQRPDEQLLTGETADRVTAAALARYPGATIHRVETDSDGVYEAHLVTADGTRVTVEVGEDFTVTGEEAGGPPR